MLTAVYQLKRVTAAVLNYASFQSLCYFMNR